jgi:hypothetical protein
VRSTCCECFSYNTVSLAPSPRLIAFLAKRANRTVNAMALAETKPQGLSQSPTTVEEKQPKPIFEEPSPVLVTPCDPWPRPYYLENGLRRVAPYHFTYNTYCKERWRGRELLDVFSSEFRDRPLEYYVWTVIVKTKNHKLTGLERCNRTRSCSREWKTSTYP